MPPKDDKKEPAPNAAGATGGAAPNAVGGVAGGAASGAAGGSASGGAAGSSQSGGTKSSQKSTGATNKLPAGSGPTASTPPPPGRTQPPVGRDDGLIQLSPAALQQLLAAAVATATGVAPSADVNHRKLPKFWEEEAKSLFSP